ncbi:MAG: precorrin-6A/cobalt-precorrin-6A reductase, partial [Pseudonocardiales bacterium]|nr:precorrin-6A/cobalt-precorrin-6A reductase [Pseudonocardiales bacterium]
MRVLILGGTGEARALAAELSGRPGVAVISSLAGRVSDPALPVGAVRVGGFGGVAGLVEYLAGVDVLVDATHPFAATISAHAAQASAETGR